MVESIPITQVGYDKLRDELKKLKLLSNILLEMTEDKILKLLELGELFEVNENV